MLSDQKRTRADVLSVIWTCALANERLDVFQYICIYIYKGNLRVRQQTRNCYVEADDSTMTRFYSSVYRVFLFNLACFWAGWRKIHIGSTRVDAECVCGQSHFETRSAPAIKQMVRPMPPTLFRNKRDQEHSLQVMLDTIQENNIG